MHDLAHPRRLDHRAQAAFRTGRRGAVRRILQGHHAAAEAGNFRLRVTEQMDSLLSGGDLLLLPTAAPGIAPLKNTPQADSTSSAPAC